MDKNAIKKFAIWARKEMLSGVMQRASLYGITENVFTRSNPIKKEITKMDISELDIPSEEKIGEITQIQKRQKDHILKRIEKEGFLQVMEEAACIWFLRIIAMQYLELNGFLSVFMETSTKEILEKKTFLLQCHALHSYLPFLFQEADEDLELLLLEEWFFKGRILDQMTQMIEKKDWIENVQMIGWLYQFYISEPKDVLINAKKQYKDKDVAYVTQIFTSDWIVKYMVENTLGRYWIEENHGEIRNFSWEYYLQSEFGSEAKSEYTRKNLTHKKDPKELMILDPCMGSGHILVYVFDLLIEIYQDYGYRVEEAVPLILQKNLIGLDISKIACRIGTFAVIMKAAQYDSSILKKKNSLNIYCMDHELQLSEGMKEYIADGNPEIFRILSFMEQQLQKIDLYGSLIHTENVNYDLVIQAIQQKMESQPKDYAESIYQRKCEEILSFAYIAWILSDQYDFVITNPPYIGNKYLPKDLKRYLDVNYKKYKKDIFAAFMARILDLTKTEGTIGMLTPYVWMFLPSYEKLRRRILEETVLSSLVQLEYNAFEDACVPVCSFTLKKGKEGCGNRKGDYVRLSEFRGSEMQGPKVIEAAKNPNCSYRYLVDQSQFNLIPGSPIAYWADENLIQGFVKGSCIETFASPKQGMATTDNHRFLRNWTEVELPKILFGCESKEKALNSGYKWFPYNKGGPYRKWFGNNLYVVNYEHDGQEIKENVMLKYPYLASPDFVVKNTEYYFKKSITWSYISSSNFGVRASEAGYLFDVSGSSLFVDDSIYKYILGFLCSKVSDEYIKIINPTMNIQAGSVGNIPVIFDEQKKARVEELVDTCIRIAKEDWDLKEISWDFRVPGLMTQTGNSLKSRAKKLEASYNERICKLRKCEEELNHIFFEIYHLEDVYSASLEEQDITIASFDLEREVKAFLSYAVGCVFGRYSFDAPGIAYAGGPWDASRYATYQPVEDNILPVYEDASDEDDMLSRFLVILKKVCGEESFEENLSFLADEIGGDGTPVEVLRHYFMNGFFKDHCKIYQKKPIYWLFDSGRKDGWKCYIYIHRYEPGLISKMKNHFLLPRKQQLECTITEIEKASQMLPAQEKANHRKLKKRFEQQWKEITDFEDKLKQLEDQKIMIDLDDGIAYNYKKLEMVLAKIR